VVTSPPYWGLRDYGTAEWIGGDAECDHNPQRPDGGQRADRTLPLGRGGMYRDTCRKCGAGRVDNQLGLEPTIEQYIANMVAVFREVWRVLRSDGSCWLNLGDSYAGSQQTGGLNSISGHNKSQPHANHKRNTPNLKPKDLCGIPWRLALALQADGWWLRSDIIWHKPNPMPESVTDRPTKSHEYLFLLTKSKKYFYDADAVREGNTTGTIKRLSSGEVQPIGSNGTKASIARGDKGGAYNHPAGRNRRTVWTIPTRPYSGSHFATYPPDLVEPCIKAGTSERGCCPECGNPWERVVERKAVNRRDKENGDSFIDYGMYSGRAGESVSKTTGWRPTCNHDAEPIPCKVFDPFVGSGTTLLVARALGRYGVGTDLSEEYLHLARTRLSLDALEEWQNGPGEVTANLDGLPMFTDPTP